MAFYVGRMKARCRQAVKRQEVVGLGEGTSWLMGFSQRRAAADGVIVQHKAGRSYRPLCLRKNEQLHAAFLAFPLMSAMHHAGTLLTSLISGLGFCPCATY